MIKILVKRIAKKPNYTIGKLFINGVFFANTLEDTDRGLTQNMSEDEIKKKKIYGQTAIPTGTYKVTLDVVSPKFSKYPFYNSINGGRVPRLLNVKGFEGILIHVMDGPKGAELSEGCIGVGRNLIKGGLLQGKEYYKKLYDILKNNNVIPIKILCNINILSVLIGIVM